ncbi:hypothetical protein MUK42_10891 [Musa troglodytarum]|uniref:Uncharacterized protein n=1 Tax=Musa troglodytarum TaxID=320322 RepID=A0A9E7FP47_9LILI|nr:hypothetical protein MUK42_10891 [Musa troglodytarum]
MMQSSGNGSNLFQLESSADGGKEPKKHPSLRLRKIALVHDDEVFPAIRGSSQRNGSCGDHRPQWKQMLPVRVIISRTLLSRNRLLLLSFMRHRFFFRDWFQLADPRMELFSHGSSSGRALAGRLREVDQRRFLALLDLDPLRLSLHILKSKI